MLSLLPPLDPLRIGEHIHGHLGWLAVASLVHPALLLRHYGRRAHWAVVSAVTLSTLAAALGAWLYGPYREGLRQPIFAAAPTLGYLFERKEHLAFGSVLLGWGGAAAYFGAAQATSEARGSLRRAAHLAFVASAALALLAAVMGTVVAAYRTF